MDGRCAVCHGPGPPERTRDFLCEECVDPLMVCVYCAACGERTTLQAPCALQFLRDRHRDPAPQFGTAIRLEGGCGRPQCTPPKENGVALAHRIRIHPLRPPLPPSDPPAGRGCGVCGALLTDDYRATICADCTTARDRVKTYCGNCGARTAYDADRGETLLRSLFPTRHIPLGVTLHLDCCIACDPLRAPGNITVHIYRK